MDYSSFRLQDPAEIEPFKSKLGDKEFYKYAIGIYKYIAKMLYGTKFDIEKGVADHNKEIFIKIACLYWIDFPGQIQFNETFTEIKRI